MTPWSTISSCIGSSNGTATTTTTMNAMHAISLLMFGIFQTNDNGATTGVVLKDRIVQLTRRWNTLPTVIYKKTTPTPPPRSQNDIMIKIYQGWFRLPQVFRFFVSGNMGNLCFFYLEQVVFGFLSNSYNHDGAGISSHNIVEMIPPLSAVLKQVSSFVEQYQDGVSFFTAYSMQIVVTHLLHALLVYGWDTINTQQKYMKTLWGQFRVYAFGLVGSTILNTYLLQCGLDKTIAFFSTMLIFACFNYFLISWIVKNAVESSSSWSKRSSTSLSSASSPFVTKRSNNYNNSKNMRHLSKDKEGKRNEKTTTTLKKDQHPRSKQGGNVNVRGWLVDKIQRGGAIMTMTREAFVDGNNLIFNGDHSLSLQDYVVIQTDEHVSTFAVNQLIQVSNILSTSKMNGESQM